jgi:hypothetical protein
MGKKLHLTSQAKPEKKDNERKMNKGYEKTVQREGNINSQTEGEILNLIFNEKNAEAPFFTHQIGKSPEVYKPYVLSGCGKTGALFHHW